MKPQSVEEMGSMEDGGDRGVQQCLISTTWQLQENKTRLAIQLDIKPRKPNQLFNDCPIPCSSDPKTECSLKPYHTSEPCKALQHSIYESLPITSTLAAHVASTDFSKVC